MKNNTSSEVIVNSKHSALRVLKPRVLVNLGAAIPNQSLAIVIEGNGRVSARQIKLLVK